MRMTMDLDKVHFPSDRWHRINRTELLGDSCTFKCDEIKFISGPTTVVKGLTEKEVDDHLAEAEIDRIYHMRRHLRGLFNEGIIKERWYKKACIRLHEYGAKRGICLGA